MASDTCTITINGATYQAKLGDTLLEAGSNNRVGLAHDCLSGRCGSCRVRVLGGDIDDCGTRENDSVLACQATIEGDAEIAFDPAPATRTIQGEVDSIETIGPDVLQVRLRMDKAVSWLPGHYIRLKFRGYPPRDYSPTFALDLGPEPDLLVFHMDVRDGGQVSAALGKDIAEGHRVAAVGPFGNAFLRRRPGRLILVSTGTGFGPLWAIAVAATLRGTDQPVKLISGARRVSGLYMRQAVGWLRARGASVILTAEDGDGTLIRTKAPQNLLPDLAPSDMVHAAGAPAMVEAVRATVLAAGADFHANAFSAAEPQQPFQPPALPRAARLRMTAGKLDLTARL